MPGSIPICLARTPTSRCRSSILVPSRYCRLVTVLGDKQTKDTRQEVPFPHTSSSANDADPAPPDSELQASSLVPSSSSPNCAPGFYLFSSSAPLYLFVPHHLARAPSLPELSKPLNLLRTWSPSRSLAPMCGQMGLLHCKPDPVTYLTAACGLGRFRPLHTLVPEAAPGANPPFQPCLPRGSHRISISGQRRVLRSLICLPVPAKTVTFPPAINSSSTELSHALCQPCLS